MLRFLILLTTIHSLTLADAPILVSVTAQSSNPTTGGFPHIQWRVTDNQTDSVIIVRTGAEEIFRDTVYANTSNYYDKTILPNREYTYAIIGKQGDTLSEPSNSITYSTDLIDIQKLIGSIFFAVHTDTATNISYGDLLNPPQQHLKVVLLYRKLGTENFHPLDTFERFNASPYSLELNTAMWDSAQGYQCKAEVHCDTFSAETNEHAFFNIGHNKGTLKDLVDWTEFQEIASMEALDTFPMSGSSNTMWLDSLLLVREFDSSLTAISLSETTKPVLLNIIKNEFTANSHFWNIGNQIFAACFDAEEKLHLIRATYNNETIEIVDTIAYPYPLTPGIVSDILNLNDSTVALAIEQDMYQTSCLYVTQTSDSVSFSKASAIDPMEGLSLSKAVPLDNAIATVWAGFSDYHKDMVLCRDTGETVTPISISDYALNTQYMEGTLLLDETVFTQSKGFHIDAAEQYAYCIEGYGDSLRLVTYALTFQGVPTLKEVQPKQSTIALSRVGDNLQFSGLRSETYQVSLYSLNGRLLYNTELTSQMNSMSLQRFAQMPLIIRIQSEQRMHIFKSR